MNADFWSAFLLPLPATQEWGEDRGDEHLHTSPSSPQPSPPSDGGEGVSLVTAGTEQQENIEHRTSNTQWGLPGCLFSMFGVGCWMLDVGCWMFCRLEFELAVASRGKPANLSSCWIDHCKSWPSRAVCIGGRSPAPLCCMSPNA